jgi:alanine dehydrogenase
MAKGSVLCDATACDYDLAETCISSDSVSYTYAEEGVIHYNCDHIPALVPSTATRLLTDATFPYVRSLSLGLYKALSQEPALVKAVMCYSRHLTHKYSAGKKGLEYTDLTSLL